MGNLAEREIWSFANVLVQSDETKHGGCQKIASGRDCLLKYVNKREMKMIKHVKSLLAFASDRRGVTALEYALIAGIVVVVIAVGFGVYAGNLSAQFNIIGGGV